ncbi:MAG: HEAT repeat domain-containing protein, partial [Planctomycetota bacterium]
MQRNVYLPLIVLALWLFPVFDAPLWGQDEDKGSAKNETRIQALIKELGAEDYEKREEAFETLKAIGEAAKPCLKKSLDSEDPEIRWRASRLLTVLEGRKVMRLGP